MLARRFVSGARVALRPSYSPLPIIARRHPSCRAYALWSKTPDPKPIPEAKEEGSPMPTIPMNDPRVAGLFEKLVKHPDAMAAFEDFVKVMQKNDVDITKRPGMMTMMKLSRNPDFVQAAMKLQAEMGKAGIDLKEMAKLMGA